jgi:hypothetical protein
MIEKKITISLLLDEKDNLELILDALNSALSCIEQQDETAACLIGQVLDEVYEIQDELEDKIF